MSSSKISLTNTVSSCDFLLHKSLFLWNASLPRDGPIQNYYGRSPACGTEWTKSMMNWSSFIKPILPSFTLNKPDNYYIFRGEQSLHCSDVSGLTSELLLYLASDQRANNDSIRWTGQQVSSHAESAEVLLGIIIVHIICTVSCIIQGHHKPKKPVSSNQ